MPSQIIHKSVQSQLETSHLEDFNVGRSIPHPFRAAEILRDVQSRSSPKLANSTHRQRNNISWHWQFLKWVECVRFFLNQYMLVSPSFAPLSQHDARWKCADEITGCVNIYGQERERSTRALFNGRHVASLTGDYCRSYCDNSMKRQVTYWTHWA